MAGLLGIEQPVRAHVRGNFVDRVCAGRGDPFLQPSELALVMGGVGLHQRVSNPALTPDSRSSDPGAARLSWLTRSHALCARRQPQGPDKHCHFYDAIAAIS